MSAVRSVLALALVGVLVAGGVVLTGWRPATVATDELTPSVRANPGSYRPAYAHHTGYQPYRTSSGGGGGVVYVGGGSRSSGGGYGYGK